ncbi:MAG: SH3 domain-containing protein [Anaerolineae bacterium]|nr:SH3 domain-containing protein [Anaerolineae bacterium]
MWLAKGLTLDLAVDRLVDLLPLLAVATIGIAILELGVYFFFKKVLRSRYTLPYTLVAPAAVALLLFTVYPFVYNIRLSFSDLRLKTIACYIPNTDVTSAECSLGQAAPGADVNIKVEALDVRAEPNEEADVVLTLERGDEVYVTDKRSKISGHIIYGGSPLKINEDGTLSNEICGVDPLCVRQFNEFKANVIDVQDERDWWPVKNSEGQTGWIPNQFFYVEEDADLYSEGVGDAELVGSVSKNEAVRQIITSKTDWYEIQLDGSSAWVSADLIASSQSFFPAGDADVFEEMSDTSTTLGTLAADEEVNLIQAVTVTWYQVLAGEDTIGWLNLEAQDIGTIDVFTATGDADLYAERDQETEPLAQITAGDEVTLLQTDTTTTADVTWYLVVTADGAEGWTTVTPYNQAEVEVLTLAAEVPLYDSSDRNSDTITTVSAGEQVRLIERDDSHDVTWYRIRHEEAGIGWVNVKGDIATNYTLTADAQAYAGMGATGGVVAELPEDERVSLVQDEAQTFRRYQVRRSDGTIGWISTEPREEITTERDTVLYSLNYGWDNFKRVFVKEDDQGNVAGWGRLLQTENSTFPRLMRTTLAWTVLNVIFHLSLGMMLAMMLNRPKMRLRGIYRAIIILPWAIPQPIIALAWKGEFNYQFGFVNALFQQVGLDPVNWLYTPTPAFIAVTFVNIWLGIPFYMVTLLGGLQSIAGAYYEAAEIDGANGWQRFRHITIPLIRPVAVPIVTLDVIWTFNNFNVIYLITKGEPNESTNILVTALYNAAFGENGQFQLGFAAAFSLVIFAVLFIFASFWVTSSGALKGVYES